MQYNVFGSKHRSNVQGNEASIVEFGNKHGNRDEFPDFVDLFIFGIKNVRVDRKHTHIFFGLMVFNATFNNISVILWQSVLVVEKPPTCRKSLTNFIT